MKKIMRIMRSEPLLLLALPVSLIPLLMIFILRSLIKIRIGFLRCDRIGHFAANTELYLCERDRNQFGSKKPLDLFYLPRKPCNHQLARMWARELIVLPWFFMRPLDLIIRLFNGLSSFHVFEARGGDRDIDHLMENTIPHLKFSPEEERRGEAGLLAMGIPEGAPFVCLTVRDAAYLKVIYPKGNTEYHDYRDTDIQNYVLASEELAERGFFVIRMGEKVLAAINSSHPNVIDYATNGMRDDFMDIYLGANCAFCITVGTGFDAVPLIFRRPIVQVNTIPFGEAITYGKTTLLLAMHHTHKNSGLELTLSEIFSKGVGFCTKTSDYESNGVNRIENTPEEIRDVVIEMAERIAGTWKAHPDDDVLQKLFWKIFPTGAVRTNGVPIHGEIRSRFGAFFLRNNKEWLS
jgi:putative glycosyltransferase (TIGR04372 family)